MAWLRVETGAMYRLPSEAEWEYAARAGTTTAFSFGDNITADQANYDQALGMSTLVGQYPANEFGVHDMHGNLWEWTEDCYTPGYVGAPVDGGVRHEDGCRGQVLRGGSWFNSEDFLRSARRFRITYGGRNGMIGFRVARTQ